MRACTRRTAVIAASTVLAQALGAQAVTGHPVVDSAATARTAWSVAVQASGRGDLRAAHRALVRASDAWPEQAAYLWQRARFAALIGDTADAMEMLRRYAALGWGRDLRDSAFGVLHALPGFAALEAAHRANRAPLARSSVRWSLSDSALWPESVDRDPATGTIYLTSIRERTIVALGADGRERDVIPRRSAGVGAFLGVRVDTARGVLWATHAGMPQMAGWTAADTLAELMAIRLSDGSVMRRIPFDPATRHVPGDLAITAAGDLLITDSRTAAIHRLRPGASGFESIVHPLFRSLQGIALSATEDVAYVADYSHGILRVNLETGAVTRLAVPHGVSTLGVDGIALHAGALIAIQNGVAPARVVRFRLDESGTRITAAETLDRNTAVADEPTMGILVGDELIYVANSQWEKYAADGSRRPGTQLVRPVLLALPLRGTPAAP